MLKSGVPLAYDLVDGRRALLSQALEGRLSTEADGKSAAGQFEDPTASEIGPDDRLLLAQTLGARRDALPLTRT